jgi:transcriptional regulator with XRE-family HTH domain
VAGVTEGDKRRGDALRAARKAAGSKQREVAKHVQRCQAWVSRIEQGIVRPTPNELELLLELYTPADDLRMTIQTLCTPAPAGPERNSRFDPKFLKFRNLELTAEEVFALTSERLPMGLQSDQYLLNQYKIAGHTDSARELLAERRRRQEVFTEGGPGRYKVIIAESALYRMPGGNTDLIEDQASYLLTLIDTYPGLHLQVLRFSANLAYVDADQIILRLPGDSTKIAVPYGATVRMLTGTEATDCMDYWRSASKAALDVDNSRKFIHLVAKNGLQLG